MWDIIGWPHGAPYHGTLSCKPTSRRRSNLCLQHLHDPTLRVLSAWIHLNPHSGRASLRNLNVSLAPSTHITCLGLSATDVRGGLLPSWTDAAAALVNTLVRDCQPSRLEVQPQSILPNHSPSEKRIVKPET